MSSDDRNLAGEQVSTCVLEKLIGAGGMGVVYLARQTRPSRYVAVKLLRPSIGLRTEAYQEFLARFRREADVIAQLDHINILPIYEYGESNNLAYLIMPYLNGGSLRTLLQNRGRLSPREALPYVEQATSALQYAHMHKIVHRDIKPANMLFHSDGRLVLVDFGIARIMHDSTEQTGETLTHTGNFMGSVEYMAPEMIQGKNVDYRADIYELGVVLYQMLAGRVPFQGSSPFTLASMHMYETPSPLMTFNSALSPDIDAIVQKALAKDPAARYQSMLEFADAYRRVAAPSVALLYDEARLTGGLPYQPWPVTQDIQDIQEDSGVSSSPDSYFVRDDSLFGDDSSLNEPTRLAQDSSHGSSPSMPPVSAQPYPTLTPHSSPTIATTPDSVPDAANVSPPQSQIPDTPRTLPDAGTTYSADAHSSIGNSNIVTDVPSSPPPGKRRVLPWLLAFVAVCLVALLGFMVYRLAQPSALPISATATTTPVRRATPTPAPVPSSRLARASVQQYFDDINQQDYQGAYQQWDVDSGYRKATSYEKFANGFVNTVHDDVTINAVTPNADGSYRVELVLHSTNKTSDGSTSVSSYRGYYDVALVDGTWKLESAQVAQSQ